MPGDRHAATVKVVNTRGLHARAAAKFVKTAEPFEAEVWVERDGMEVAGTSIMGLMMLGAGRHAELALRASGPEAEAALAALVDLVRKGFGEDVGPG